MPLERSMLTLCGTPVAFLVELSVGYIALLRNALSLLELLTAALETRCFFIGFILFMI